MTIPHICHGRRLCKFFLASVNFFRFNAKNWQFSKLAFFCVNFILQKFCSCKKDDKYQVCTQVRNMVASWSHFLAVAEAHKFSHCFLKKITTPGKKIRDSRDKSHSNVYCMVLLLLLYARRLR